MASPVSLISQSLRRTVVACSSRKLHLSACKNSQLPERRKKPFSILNGDIDTKTNEFATNTEASKQYESKYREILAKSYEGGGEKAIARHVKQHKKLWVEDRIRLLLDDYDEFLELSTIAGYAMPYGDIARAGILGGIGKIHGKYCMIIANDGSVKGGTVFPITLKKQLRLQEIAQQNRLPCIYAVDSGGAFLPLQSEIFLPGGRTFYNEAVMSAMGIPQIAVVCGNCTAGGAYVPTMADEAVIVHRIGTIFLGGPPLVQAATGEIISAEDLGGATLHCSVSGCTDYYAADEYEGFQTGRDLVESLNLPRHPGPTREPEEPLFDPTELSGLIPAKGQENMDIRKVISRIVDGSRFNEFKVQFGSTLVTGFAHIQGYLVGIVANNGDMTDKAAAKGAHFVQMCSERYIPLVFLHNTVSKTNTSSYGVFGGDMLRDHAKLMGAISCAKVPKISVIVGNSIGHTNYTMCGRSGSPNFMFSWPNAVLGMMDKTELVQNIIQEKYQGKDVSDEERQETEKKLIQKYSLEMSAFYNSSRLHDDGIIVPQNTRKVIGRCLDITSAYLPQTSTDYSVIRM